MLAVGPATQTMQIVLLVDDSGPGINDVREGVAGFIRIVQRTAEIAIVSTAKQNTVLLDFTSDPGALMGGVNRLVTRTTTGGYQLEAIRESANTLMRREAPARSSWCSRSKARSTAACRPRWCSTTFDAAERWFTSSASASRR